MFETKDTLVRTAAERHGLDAIPVMPFVWSIHDPRDNGRVAGYVEYDTDRSHRRYMVQRIDAEMHHDTSYHNHAYKALESLA